MLCTDNSCQMNVFLSTSQGTTVQS